MAHRVSLSVLFLSTLAIAAVYAAAFLPGGAPTWAVYLLAAATPASMIAAMALGAVKDGRIGLLWIPFGLAFVVMAGGFWLVLALPPADPGAPELWLGLPRRTAIVLYGIGLIPYLIIPVSYALTFDGRTLTEADITRVREAGLAFREVRLAPRGTARSEAPTAATETAAASEGR
jgi:hypothetical protein